MLQRPSFALLGLPILLFACGGEEPDDLICPLGTVAQNNGCVPIGADASTPDTGSGDSGDPDGGTGLDAQPADGGEDGGPSDLGPNDGSPADLGPIDAGEGLAALTPATLDFGRTVLGETVEASAEIRNPGSTPVLIRTGLLGGAGAADYTIVASATISASGLTLGPGELVTLTVRFTPRAIGIRSASFPISLCAAGCDTNLNLSGEGLLDALSCAPSLIDFGLVNPGACGTAPVACTNTSGHNATISGVGFASGSAPTFSVTSTGTAPWVVAAAATQQFQVDYCPSSNGRQTGTLEIQVVHPDPVRRVQSIAVAGTGGGGDIRCSPSTLDFGIAGVGQNRTRNLTCTNQGDAPLAINNAQLEAGSSGTFSVSPASLPATVPPGGNFLIAVDFDPIAVGVEMGGVEISSDDRDTPVVLIPLLGEALAPNGCTVTITPGAIELGAVRLNTTTRGSARIANTGTGACAVTVVGLSASTPGVFVLPNTLNTLLQPGADVTLEVDFTPTAAQAYAGAIELQTTDLAQPSPTVALAGTGSGPGYPLSALPAPLDFGVIAPSCSAPATRNLNVRNGGAQSLQVTVAREAGTPAAFTINGGANTSVTIAAGATVPVEIGFSPGAAGSYAGRLQLSAPSLAPLFVAVSGDSAANAQNIETFASSGPGVVDVLLIVDDSGSMSEEQARLSAAAPALLARGDAAGADYHVGVTTTDPGPSPFPIGTLRGTPRYVTSVSATRIADLTAAVNQGVNGSGTEEGLAAAAAAVTDATLLAGTNLGFLRPNAELAVVILSDEEDFSPGTVTSYVQAMSNRSVGIPGSLRIFGITGGPSGCSTPNGTADPGVRYEDAAIQTGGFTRSICEADYTAITNEIADAIFLGTRAVYPLASRPAPGTVEVRINGTLLPATNGVVVNWGLDYQAAQLIFVGGNGPPAGAAVEVRYQSVCVPATCGNGSLQAGEQCDDADADNTDLCLDTCYQASCGDNFVRTNVEQCDDGNTVPGDGCNQSCIIEGCGNGIPEPGEECDDGPANSDTNPNACRTDCRDPYCRDGVQDQGEACDDGNLSNTDACVGNCVAAVCGDGFTRAGVEQCDDGNNVDTDLCRNNCTFNAASFTVTSQAAVLTPTAGGGAIALDDENQVTLPISFPFSFLGTPATNVNIHANGMITFDQANAALYQNVTIPTAATPNAFVAWWWDDLDFGRVIPGVTPSATQQTLGTAPNRIRVFTFQNVPHWTTGDVLLNAEVRLFETTNVITVHYGTATAGITDDFSASVGWEGAGGVIGADVLGCGATCNGSNWPTNTRYTFTP
ncbi:MAG: choice-of-anchor D domain-containing protein [Deltaproteobacteria bacterium]|nr:choice-of-anchor D domain-containing protein [Deltaproteobacteria bacterium]